MIAPSDAGLSDMEVRAWLDDSLNSYIVGYYVHGVYTGLFGISIWLILAVKRISKTRIYMGCVITALYILSTIAVIASWIEFSDAYVFGMSARARYDLMYSSTLLEIIGCTASALNLIIADCTIIWRCWVVWIHNWKAVILPVLLVISEIVCGGILLLRQFTVSSYDNIVLKWALATMATTLGTNILCTTLIVARIIHVAKMHRGVMGSIRTYRGVIGILVESAALYSTIYVVLMILYPLEGNGYMYPQMLVYPITGITPTLIIGRVASGQARAEDSSHGVQSSLHFQTPRGSTIETMTDDLDEDTISYQRDMEGATPITGRLESSGAELV
ncbi:uncharacterized protein EV420DRAFT_517592 [Desarmillaria tabescens]|uniref:Uncharacterized protein n=1 Tax=Armillaria tabescens TaxID=1929756 RepID=A0AA39N4M2_ARMTA|nr:uncharacterized protein EV420DRAFT_517592 [Desarmillaria tabescens]KAK0457293.1 hypothetical protein EV420DRAFT_517592 [Desarmillaria tabescens]